MPQQDADASELEEAEEVLGVSLVAGDESAEVLEPGEEALDLPAPAVAAEGTAVLGLELAAPEVGRDELDASLLPQPRIEAVAVVGTVADQSVGGVLEEPCVDRRFEERDLMR